MSHHETAATNGEPFGHQPSFETLNGVVEYFLSRYKYFDSDKRLQALVFYTDYRHYQEHDEQLTNARWEPYMYGMFSDDVRNALENSRAATQRILVNGKRLHRYLTISDPDLDGVPAEFLNDIHAETKSVETTNLATFAKNVPMFEHTDYNDVAVFNDTTVASLDDS